jgi:hypothetical protein
MKLHSTKYSRYSKEYLIQTSSKKDFEEKEEYSDDSFAEMSK